MDEPVAADGNNDTGGNDPDTRGGNHNGTSQYYTTSGSTSQGERSSSHLSSSSGGADQGSNSYTHQSDTHQEESSRNNLSRQAVWSRAHPWELIVGDPQAGVQIRSMTRNECFFSGFLSQIEPEKIEETLVDLDWVIPMKDELNHFKGRKYGSWGQDLKIKQLLVLDGYSE